VSKLADGTPYMVMEYLEGETLDQLLQREHPLPVSRLVDLVLQACEPLDEAHRIGIVHRDVKPENVFLATRVDEGPTVKLLDFGISKVQTSITITVSNGMMGTATYSSPEQLKNASDVGPEADVWSLGVILYEGLTGRVPWSGTSYPEICASVLHEEPPRARFHRRDLPFELDEVVLRCMQKDPAGRIRSIPDLASALAPFASEEGKALAARIVRRSSKRPEVIPTPRPGVVSDPDARVGFTDSVTPFEMERSVRPESLERPLPKPLGVSIPLPPARRRVEVKHLVFAVLSVGALLVGAGMLGRGERPTSAPTQAAHAAAPIVEASVVPEASIAPSIPPPPPVASESDADAGTPSPAEGERARPAAGDREKVGRGSAKTRIAPPAAAPRGAPAASAQAATTSASTSPTPSTTTPSIDVSASPSGASSAAPSAPPSPTPAAPPVAPSAPGAAPPSYP
jgi:hypothetical protein